MGLSAQNGQPLDPDEIFEDISQDHANKTVTIERHPHLSVSQASIHPCKHSNVMKKILDNLGERGQVRCRQVLAVIGVGGGVT